jgi:hypothetical protein
MHIGKVYNFSLISCTFNEILRKHLCLPIVVRSVVTFATLYFISNKRTSWPLPHVEPQTAVLLICSHQIGLHLSIPADVTNSFIMRIISVGFSGLACHVLILCRINVCFRYYSPLFKSWPFWRIFVGRCFNPFFFRQLVELRGCGVGQLQRLRRTSQRRSTRTNIHASSGIRTRGPIIRTVKTHALYTVRPRR